ncbi:MAG: epoxyqueuosine reductase QueH [Ruminococcaceae bacterium]|nr:epoxyqueuosine reductase QueH [Oscillospiraceae bacterium]
MKLLLHVCCAPCSVYCIEQLRKENIEPVLYWYNPNIHPFKEYESRRNTLINYADSINAKAIIEDKYGLDDFCKNVSSDVEKRCTAYCYPVRLRKTFEYAKNNGYDAVSTTLLYSIYQNHNFIKKLCEKLSVEYGVAFLYRDFRVGFWEGHEKAVEAGLYMQKYCGCIYSEEDRFLLNKQVKPVLPEGFEFTEKSSVLTKRIKETDGDTYILEKDGKAVCEARFKSVDENTVELVSLNSDNRIYSEKILKTVSKNYSQKYSSLIIHSFADDIAFYIKNGFDNFVKTEETDGKTVIFYSKKL